MSGLLWQGTQQIHMKVSAQYMLILRALWIFAILISNMLIVDFEAQHTFTDDPFNSLASQFAEFFFSNYLCQ